MYSSRFHLKALVFICLIFIKITVGFFCPTGCNCFQRSVLCVRARLTAVPQLPKDVTLLDLRFNRIAEIPENTFNGLSQLQAIFLNENEITTIHEGAFNGLTALRYIHLNNNRIKSLSGKVFQGLSKLEALYLENNDLRQFETETFSNLPLLSRLYIFNNSLSQLPAGSLTNLPSLKRLRLDGNPIVCDCGIYSLWQYYQKHPQRGRVTIALNCASPVELQQRSFDSLGEQHFHCKMPEIIEPPHDMHLTIGESVELKCQVHGDPTPNIFWMQNTNEIPSSYHSPRMQVMPDGSLRINAIEMKDIGIYECIARNQVGETKSQPIRLMVDDSNNNNNNIYNNPQWPDQNAQAPRFVHQPSDKTIALNADSSSNLREAVVLDCVATGQPQPEILWFFNGRLITQSTDAIRIQSNGSLVITQATSLTLGTYRCEATNSLGSIQANARVDAKEYPEILIAPQNQTIKLGKPFVLECDADGNPVPIISWQFNGADIISTDHITLENENTELIVSAAWESDTGTYTCIAENENGKTIATAQIKIERARSAPRLLIEPSDLQAFTGTTIELPCKAEEDGESMQITWRRDGRIIDPNVQLVDKYQVSGTGSLFVKNVTIRDGGRYECSLKNEFGRVTASALVTIKDTVDLAPGDRYVRIAFAEASKEIDLAINNTIETLFTKRTATNASGNATSPNYGDLLRVFRFPTGEARQLARAAEIYERTLVNIRKHVLKGDNLSMASDGYEFKDLLSREHLHLVAELSGCMEHREMPNCTDMCYHSKYRSIDGTCNNLRHPTWGASLTSFRRIARPIYEDGFSAPIGFFKDKLYAGYPKPSARLVSTSLISTKEITPDETITHMVMQWGQFIDHDMDHAIPSVSSESWDGIDCKKTCDVAPPCFPIEVPPNDPRIKNRRCIDLIRSSAICGSGMTSIFFDSVQHREQINQLTAYIDASQVYGYKYEFAQELRNLSTDDGLLRVGVHFPHQKDMLPFAAPQDGMDCRRNLNENTMSCFVAGDIRVNEQIGLTAMHTLWMREHNRIAIKLREINPQWDGDTLYQEARKIVGAQMQHITYKHWLPLIIGESGMRALGEYQGYDPNMESSIANVFATAAFRFGHTLINPVLHRLNTSFQPIPQGHLQLHKAFFAPWRIAYEGGVDPLLRGMFAVSAKLKTPAQNLNTELTEKLFQTAHAVALDLAAINIQRGREHGMPGYNEYRKFCNMTVPQTFDELQAEISDADTRQKLKELYGHPDNIDVWVGGILEDQVEGGKVGPLIQCLLVEQFRRLRDGDRFYYENPSVFMPEQLQQIKQSNLGRVLCDSGDKIEEVTDNVFLLAKRQGGYKKCEDIPGINLYYWQDCGACNSLPPLFDVYVPETYVKSFKRHKRAIDTAVSQHNQIHADSDGTLDEMLDFNDINEERISGLEDIISSFQKELKKLHKKLRKLEASCEITRSSIVSELPPQPRRNYCIDQHGTTRINNEIWTFDSCTTCQCHHAQINCTHEKCPEITCENGMKPIMRPEECCAQCSKIDQRVV